IKSLANGALSKVFAQQGKAKEALEAAQEGLKWLDEPGGKDRGGEAEVHSAYVQALDQNGKSKEAAAVRAEHPDTTREGGAPAGGTARAAKRPAPGAGAGAGAGASDGGGAPGAAASSGGGAPGATARGGGGAPGAAASGGDGAPGAAASGGDGAPGAAASS